MGIVPCSGARKAGRRGTRETETLIRLMRYFILIAGLLLRGDVMAAQVREGKLDRGGFDLHYRIYGSGTPLLVLSGGPGFDCD